MFSINLIIMSKKTRRSSNKNLNGEDEFDNFRRNAFMEMNDQIQRFNGGVDRIFNDFGIRRMNLGNSLLPGTTFSRDLSRSLAKPFKRENIETEMEEFEPEPEMKIPGKYVSHSHFSATKLDKNGKEYSENFQSQSISNIDNQGKRISERQQAYKNSRGEDKIVHEKMLDNKGYKLIKSRNIENNETCEHNYLKGLKEEKLDEFNKEYDKQRKKVKLENNFNFLECESNRKNLLGNKKKLLLPDQEKADVIRRK